MLYIKSQFFMIVCVLLCGATPAAAHSGQEGSVVHALWHAAAQWNDAVFYSACAAASGAGFWAVRRLVARKRA